MQALDVLRQLVGKDQRLAESAHAAWRRIAPQIAQPEIPRFPVARISPFAQPGAQDAQRLEQEVFGQVQDGRTDFVVYRVAARIRRTAQRNDQDIQAAMLERRDFLRNEGLREPWIPLQDEGDTALHRPSHGTLEPGLR